jgi:hypothetical protein
MAVTSNVSTRATSYKVHALSHILSKTEFADTTFCMKTKGAIADSGATQIFVIEGMPVNNKCKTTHQLRVALADGRQVLSTHECDIHIDGLLTVLMGHIIPDFSIASLFRIRILTDAGCEVIFDRDHCTVKYNGGVILVGGKDPDTNLWTLPLGLTSMTSHCIDNAIPPAAPVYADAHAHLSMQIAFFTHTMQTKANSIIFAHQSLYGPKISMLFKAIRCGYLKGCPNLTAKGVTKYLNPSPTTAKGHMKRP